MFIKIKKTNTILNAREFYEGRREILIVFEENMFPLPKPYVFHENEWKEKDIPGNEKFMPKTFKLSFLEKNNQTELSEKENKFLYIYFKYKNIDELMVAFKNTKTDDELDELFDKIVNKLNIFKKLINTVPDITEKKRINNLIKNIEFVLNYLAFYKNTSYIDINKKFLKLNFMIQKEVD